LLVDAHSKNNITVIYNGRNPDKDGKPDDRTTPNYWLDMDGKCIVNIGDCCQPSSLVTKEAINTRLQLIVVGMIQEILKSPEQFLLRAGVKYYAADQRDLDSQEYF